MEINLGEVIASRSYIITDSNATVTVLIGKPSAFDDGQDYFCPYQIIGIGNENIRHAGGVDSIQALQLALNMVKYDLEYYFKELEFRVKWQAGEGEDIGF